MRTTECEMNDLKVQTAGTEATGALDPSNTERLIRSKIVHSLTVYPCLSMSMLQMSIGTGIPPELWHPIVDALMAENVIEKTQVKSTTPHGREQVYTRIMLRGTTITLPQ